MTDHSLDLALRAAEAMREAAAKAAGGDADLLRRQGHHESANAYENAARRILAIDPVSMVPGLSQQVPDPDEQAAFDVAAKSAQFSVQRRDNGELFHPISQRAYAVWHAAVRWAEKQKRPPGP
jgi:hypothetical protein